MRRPSLLGLVSPLLALGCTSTGALVTVPLPATAIVVDPADFLGDVPCLPADGAMHRYVATLTGLHTGGILDAGAVALPSSPPVLCTQSVSFQRVVDGTAYVADIDGYDRDDIRPLGTADGGPPGSRIMVDAHGSYVAPRWTTTCGKSEGQSGEREGGLRDGGDSGISGPTDARASFDTGVVPYGRCTGHALEAGQAPPLGGPVCAIANAVISIRGCEPLHEVNPPRTQSTAIKVDLADALGSCLRCGSKPGEIAEFKVELDVPGVPPQTKACGESATFEVPGGKLATFGVTAYGSGAADGGLTCPATIDGGAPDSGADAGVCGNELRKNASGVWCTRCYRQAVSGVTLRANCDPLGVTKPPPY